MVKPDPTVATTDVQFIDTRSPKHPVLLPYQTLLVTEQEASMWGPGVRSVYALASSRKRLELLLDYFRATFDVVPDKDHPNDELGLLGYMAVWDERKGEVEANAKRTEVWEMTVLVRDKKDN